jgi:hypothetical protein
VPDAHLIIEKAADHADIARPMSPFKANLSGIASLTLEYSAVDRCNRIIPGLVSYQQINNIRVSAKL